MNCLEELERVSGLALNPSKSVIYLAGVQGPGRADILERVGFREGEFPVRYLGVPLVPNTVAVSQFAPFTDAISENISKWAPQKLSYAGKIELIRSVIQGIAGFWLRVFPVQVAVVDKINSACLQFFWGGRSARVAWPVICTPKEEGGLGLMDLRVWNLALLARSIYLFHTDAESLWVDWVQSYYLKGVSFWDYTVRDRDSALFKKLCGIRDKFIHIFGSIPNAIAGLEKCVVSNRLDSSLVYDVFRTPGETKPWARLIWRGFIPPKFSFTVWLSCRKRLATRDTLSYLELTDTRCALCGAAEESQSHLFFSCPVTCEAWGQIREWLGIQRPMRSMENALKFIKKEHSSRSVRARAIQLAFCMVVHEIWRARNIIVFEGDPACRDTIVPRVKLNTYRTLYSIYPSSETLRLNPF